MCYQRKIRRLILAQAVAFTKQRKERLWKTLIKFVWQLGWYEPSSPHAKELHDYHEAFWYFILNLNRTTLWIGRIQIECMSTMSTTVQTRCNSLQNFTISTTNKQWTVSMQRYDFSTYLQNTTIHCVKLILGIASNLNRPHTMCV